MPPMLHLIPTMFGFKAIEQMIDEPWTPPPSALRDIVARLERPKPVDMCRPQGGTGESRGSVARNCGTVADGTNRESIGNSSIEGE